MRYFTVFPLVGLAAMSVQAGVVLQVSSHDLPSGKTQPAEVYYAQDGMMRVDELNGAGSITRINIVRDGVIWMVNPQDRTFTRIDAESMKGYFGAENDKLQAMIANLPPEKQALMKSRLAQMQQRTVADTYTYTDLGRGDQAGQYSCRVWSEQKSGRPYAEYCVVASPSLPGGGELAVSMKKALDTVSAAISGVPQLEKSAEHFTRMEKMNGFPVRQRYLSNSGTAERESVLASVETHALPADKFAIPQGFTEKPMTSRESD